MTKTEHYNLNQWEPDDPIRRTDFNEDNAKIDAALAAEQSVRESAVQAINTTLSGMVKFAAGSYTGDGKETRTINVGFTPKAVLVMTDSGYSFVSGSYNSTYYGGLAVTNSPVGSDEYPIVKVVGGGFLVAYKPGGATGIVSNMSNTKYNYIALG